MTPYILFQVPMMLILEYSHLSAIIPVLVASSDPSVGYKNK
jgi:hypothetical protein